MCVWSDYMNFRRCFFFFSSRRRHTRLQGDWSSDVCSSDLRHRETDTRPVDQVHAVCGVWNAYTVIAPCRYKDGGVHRPIVFKGQTRQIAKLVAAAYGLASRLPRFHGAADGAPEDDAFFGVRPSTVIRGHSIVIPRHFHPFVNVICRRRSMFLEVEAIMMNDRRLPGQNLDRSYPGVLFEGSRNRQLLPFLDAGCGNSIWRQVDDNLGLNLPTVVRPLDRRRSIFRIAFSGSLVNPRDERLDIGRLQRPVIIKVAITW